MPIFDDDTNDSAAALRRWLTGLEIATTGQLFGVRWPDGKGAVLDQLNDPNSPPPPELTREQLALPFAATVLALQSGEAHTLTRADLPDWHTARYAGAPHERLVLTEDDELIEL